MIVFFQSNYMIAIFNQILCSINEWCLKKLNVFSLHVIYALSWSCLWFQWTPNLIKRLIATRARSDRNRWDTILSYWIWHGQGKEQVLSGLTETRTLKMQKHDGRYKTKWSSWAVFLRKLTHIVNFSIMYRCLTNLTYGIKRV